MFQNLKHFFKKIIILFKCLGAFLSMYQWITYVSLPEEDVGAPLTGVAGCSELPWECWAPNLGPLQGQPVLLTTEPSPPLPGSETLDRVGAPKPWYLKCILVYDFGAEDAQPVLGACGLCMGQTVRRAGGEKREGSRGWREGRRQVSKVRAQTWVMRELRERVGCGRLSRSHT